MGEAEIDAICQHARSRVPARGRRAPERVILDFEQRRSRSRCEKRHAGHYKGGFHPRLVSWGREVLTGILRPGSTGAGDAEDHLSVVELALEQFPASAPDGEH
jgi:hypothetical protein